MSPPDLAVQTRATVNQSGVVQRSILVEPRQSEVGERQRAPRVGHLSLPAHRQPF
jgi:hypothetical protein